MILSGMSTMDQIRDNVATFQREELNNEWRQDISQNWQYHVQHAVIAATDVR